MGRNILVVEDDKNISDLIHMYLVKEGFDVRIAGDGGKALEEFQKKEPDLILLDIMLPVMDGWAVCAKIRETSKVPIIMLTAKSEVFDRIQGLEMGADDYIVKPFVRQELIARINVALRHHGNDADRGCDNVVIGGLTVDFTRHRVLVDGSDAELTQSEFRIVALLAQYAGMVITYDEMMVRLWGPNSTGGNQILRVNMTNIRRKLERDPSHPRYIFTENGVGYRMALPEEV